MALSALHAYLNQTATAANGFKARSVMSTFSRWSLSRQFLLASFPILFVGMLLIGSWVAKQIEDSVAYRIGGVMGMYVDSFIAPHVQSLTRSDDLSENDRAALNQLLSTTPLGEKIVALKIWTRDGRVLYSTAEALVGRTYEISEGLKVALDGDVHSEMSDLTGYENEFERKKWSQLIETYVPLHANGVGTVIAAAEFYHSTDELNRKSRAAQLQSWLLLSTILAVMYLLLFALVRRGSKTIDAQQSELNNKVTQLTAVIAQNNQLHGRVRRAADRTTALNEVFLRRISADLHDGPGQDMGLALMQFESIGDNRLVSEAGDQEQLSSTEEFQSIRASLKSALTDLRAISTGLQLPEIEKLSVTEIVARAVRDYESKTGVTVSLIANVEPAVTSLPVKIALYRLLQESLANGFRHANGSGQQVDIKMKEGSLMVEVSDLGAGFDTNKTVSQKHFGLVGMRERVEILGGSFDLQSTVGQGTTVRVTLPLVVTGMEQGVP
jgi:signal transduction histidine kinase